MSAPVSPDEAGRLSALLRYQILDTPPEAAFDHLTRLAAQLFGLPISLISLVDDNRVWFKSCQGLEIQQTGRELSFCAWAILADQVMIVPDASGDPRFAANPLVTGEPGIRCYVGAPLKTPDGFLLGTLCVMDTAARGEFPPQQLSLLEGLAAIVIDELELRLAVRITGEAQRAQRESEGLLASVFETAAPGMTIIDEEGRFVKVNRAYCRLIGYSREELIGRHFRMVVPPETREFAERAHANFVEADQALPAEWRLRRKDGALVDVHVTSARLVREDGQRLRVNTITDVTAIKRLEEQLHSSQKMEAISRLAGGAAHAFNNLLTIITGYSQLLRGSLPADNPLHGYADEIYKAADRAAALTSKLLAFSRRRLGEPKVLELNTVVARLEPRLRRALGGGIELVVSLRPDLAKVLADPTHIEQAVRYLATNAREAMTGGGRLTIRTTNVELSADFIRAHPELRPGAYVVLAVEDTGPGIDPEARKHLFEPFFTTKGIGKGTGLATVYGLIRQCGGDVAVSSEPGRGTTVELYLPATQQPA